MNPDWKEGGYRRLLLDAINDARIGLRRAVMANDPDRLALAIRRCNWAVKALEAWDVGLAFTEAEPV